MEPNQCGFTLAAGHSGAVGARAFGALAASDFGAVAVLIIVALGLAAVMLLLTLVVGPKRHGPVRTARTNRA